MSDWLFLHLSEAELDRAAKAQGFKANGRRNWTRRTDDFVQLVNLQRSQWAPGEHYLNFALWPLAIGEPPTIAESKFHFRTRGSHLGADLASFFAASDGLQTLDQLREAYQSGRIIGLMTRELQAVLKLG